MPKLKLFAVIGFPLIAAGLWLMAQAAPIPFRLSQWTVAPWTIASGDNYILWSTAGQSNASQLSGDNYSLRSGFQGHAGQPGDDKLTNPTPAPLGDRNPIYLPLIIKD